jgi:hypothetical protein
MPISWLNGLSRNDRAICFGGKEQEYFSGLTFLGESVECVRCERLLEDCMSS